MKKTFWLCIAFILMFSSAIQAKVYLSPILNEAHKLLTINPEQSLSITQQFMSKRKLVSTKSQDYTISREGSENTIRTPSSSVEALQIMACSYFELHAPQDAFSAIQQAEILAQQYNIIQPLLSSKFIHIELLWRAHKDPHQITPLIDDLAEQVEKEATNKSWQQETLYQIYMLRAEIHASTGDKVRTKAAFQQALQSLNSEPSTSLTIDYHLRLGQYYLNQDEYDDSLTELLTTYWLAIKESDSIELARTNLLLSELFYSRHVFDKAIEHATEAADFYDNYPTSSALAATVKLMADTYYNQGKYNLALVNYLNVLDNEPNRSDRFYIIQLHINIANTYLKLFDFTHAQIYLDQAEKLAANTKHQRLKSEILLLKAALSLSKHNAEQALSSSEAALSIAINLQNKLLQMQAYQLQSAAYEQKKQYQQALHAKEQYLHIWQNQQEQFNAVNEDVFRQQKDIIEKSLHYNGLEEKLLILNEAYNKYQRATIITLFIAFILLLIALYRGHLNQKIREELETQTIDLYTHPRSGLQNLKLLNTKLPKSLEKSNVLFEQWRLGELINEPLSDRLNFVMFDLPFLRNIYLKQGYQVGLHIEKQFGDYMRTLITKPARLYHFSDGLFLYIAPQVNEENVAEYFFNKIQTWIDGFDHCANMDKHFKMGLAEYPFLPRAYTAINDKDLIDILFMAIYLARKIHDRYPNEEQCWVSLSAIENAPAASFASNKIRQTFEQAVEQGLVKIHTSGQHDELAKAILRNDNGVKEKQ